MFGWNDVGDQVNGYDYGIVRKGRPWTNWAESAKIGTEEDIGLMARLQYQLASQLEFIVSAWSAKEMFPF